MPSKNVRKGVLRQLRAFEKAHRDYVSLGLLHPGDHKTIIDTYHKTRERLIVSLLGTQAR